MTDALLSIAHWWAVLGLFAVLVCEAVSCRGPLDPSAVRVLARRDMAYGALSLLVLVAGIGRVVLGAKGWDFYAANPWFWVKLGLFAGIGLVSIRPTVSILRWRRQAAAGGSIDAAQVAALRRWIHIELALLMLMPVAAALMARGIGI